ncbi:MAG TPA: hypothetical protein VGX28_11590 [Frankiaceae bacterium]|nr:hypothetical protein [Frankiaceae bacterium]
MRRIALAALAAAALAGGPAQASCPTDADLCVNNDVANVWVENGQVWRGGDTLVDDVDCLDERVVYALDESQSDLWYECWQGPHRVL